MNPISRLTLDDPRFSWNKFFVALLASPTFPFSTPRYELPRPLNRIEEGLNAVPHYDVDIREGWREDWDGFDEVRMGSPLRRLILKII